MSDADLPETTPPAGDVPATPPPPAGEVADAPAPERTYTAAEYKTVQNEARNLRQRLRDLEAAASGHGPAIEAVQQRAASAEAQVSDLQARLRTYELRDAVAETAQKDDALRGLDARLAVKLLDGVEWDEEGKPKGLLAALRALVETYPQLAAAPGPRLPAQPAAGGKVAGVTTDQLKQQKRAGYGAL